MLELRRRGQAWLPVGEGRAGEDGDFRVEGRVIAGPGPIATRVRAVGAGASTPVAVTVRPLRLASVGDINLGDVPGAAIAAEGPRYPWESTGRALREADIAFGNLECAVSRRGTPFPKQYNFRGTPEALRRPAPARRDRRAEPGQQPRRRLRAARHARHGARRRAAGHAGCRRRPRPEPGAAPSGGRAARATRRLRRLLEHPAARVRRRAGPPGCRLGHARGRRGGGPRRTPARRRGGGHLPLGDREDAVRDRRAGRARQRRRRRRRPARDRSASARAAAGSPRGLGARGLLARELRVRRPFERDRRDRRARDRSERRGGHGRALAAGRDLERAPRACEARARSAYPSPTWRRRRPD